MDSAHAGAAGWALHNTHQEDRMPTPPKETRKPGAAGRIGAPTRPATRPVARPTAARPVAAAKPAAGNYVHFSDKMTSALMNINDVIEDNKGTLDSIQDMALQLTRTVIVLRTVVMKYVGMVDNILETAVPIMEKLPIFPENVKEFARDALALAKKISTASEMAEKVLPGVEASLMSADVSRLQTSSGDVANLTKALQEITL